MRSSVNGCRTPTTAARCGSFVLPATRASGRFGEIYGLDHDLGRFEQKWLHPVSPVKHLYLTGQDVVTAGVGGALLGGVMTTAAMMGRRADRVFKLLKQWQPPEPA